jgi:hypothetical protein
MARKTIVTGLGLPLEPIAGVTIKIGKIEFADAEACHIWAKAWLAGLCTKPDKPVLEAAIAYALCKVFERAPISAKRLNARVKLRKAAK